MQTLKSRLIIWAAYPAVRSIFSVVCYQINYASDGFNRIGLMKSTWFPTTEKDAAAIRAAYVKVTPCDSCKPFSKF